MSRTPTRAFHGERSNAAISWLAIVVVVLVGGRALLDGFAHEVLFAATVGAVVALRTTTDRLEGRLIFGR